MKCDGHSPQNSVFPPERPHMEGVAGKEMGEWLMKPETGCLASWGPGVASQQETGHLCQPKSVCLCSFPCVGQHQLQWCSWGERRWPASLFR